MYCPQPAGAVKSGWRKSAAAIDVFDPEPPPADYPLLGFDNVLLTPHMAARTHTAVENMSWVVRDVVEVLNGRMPKHSPRDGGKDFGTKTGAP